MGRSGEGDHETLSKAAAGATAALSPSCRAPPDGKPGATILVEPSPPGHEMVRSRLVAAGSACVRVCRAGPRHDRVRHDRVRAGLISRWGVRPRAVLNKTS
jgi:hypothetical protein